MPLLCSGSFDFAHALAAALVCETVFFGLPHAAARTAISSEAQRVVFPSRRRTRTIYTRAGRGWKRLSSRRGATGIDPSRREKRQAALAHAADIDTVVLGAGPYGLSVAAHLRGAGINHAVFGRQMDFWTRKMPKGMF